jgi:hypothetical protein
MRELAGQSFGVPPPTSGSMPMDVAHDARHVTHDAQQTNNKQITLRCSFSWERATRCDMIACFAMKRPANTLAT